MSAHEVTLGRSEHIAEDTMAFHFGRPAGFAFKPGQAIDLELPAEAGGEPQRHAFSIVSAPFQGEIVVATRMRSSAYKRALGALAAGARAKIDGPFGSLTLHADRARPAVFVAGGIGITPFMSMLRQTARDDWPHQVSLVYANRKPESAAFLPELQQLARGGGRFRLFATMTAAETSALAWEGETRPLDEALLQAASAGLLAPVYYLVGPPGMVEAVRETMDHAGVREEDIRSEAFYGY